MPGSVLIADQAWAQKGRSLLGIATQRRHDLRAGRTRWVISVGGLYRGEAAAANNDIKRNIDIDSIVRSRFRLRPARAPRPRPSSTICA